MLACYHAYMRVIVWNSQKGGSGKTNLCAAIAVEAERAGDGPVFLADTDPQGTLTTWHETRQAEAPARIDVPLAALPSSLQALRDRGVTLCCIDTAPNRGDENAALFRLADLVLVPVRPSPADLWAVAATVALLNQTGRPFLFGTQPGNAKRQHHRGGCRGLVSSWTSRADASSLPGSAIPRP